MFWGLLRRASFDTRMRPIDQARMIMRLATAEMFHLGRMFLFCAVTMPSPNCICSMAWRFTQT